MYSSSKVLRCEVYTDLATYTISGKSPHSDDKGVPRKLFKFTDFESKTTLFFVGEICVNYILIN